MQVVREGCTGETVRRWQCIVGVEPDGVFGPETRDATIAWQAQRGLEPDGIVGPDTWAAAGYKPTPPIRQSVRDAFVPFTSGLEGVVPYMYLDRKGLVTVAIGNLIDPMQYALVLPFVNLDGSPATRDQIAAEWELIRSHQELAVEGHLAAYQYARLRLTAEGVMQVVLRKLEEDVSYLASRFPEIGDWPADAQLATLSMAWACGPAFRFATLDQALRDRNYDLAARACTIDTTNNPGVIRRNAANHQLYLNAAQVVAQGLDPDTLLFPVPKA